MILSISLSHNRIQLNAISVTSDLKREIKEAQAKDDFFQKKKEFVEENNGGNFVMDRPLEFLEGDHVFLKVTPITGIDRAIKSKKLTPQFSGRYQILRKVGPVAYKIALPPILSNLYNIFHVSQMKKYISDPSHIIMPDTVQLKDNLTWLYRL